VWPTLATLRLSRAAGTEWLTNGLHVRIEKELPREISNVGEKDQTSGAKDRTFRAKDRTSSAREVTSFSWIELPPGLSNVHRDGCPVYDVEVE
jgi:hypothetical protein